MPDEINQGNEVQAPREGGAESRAEDISRAHEEVHQETGPNAVKTEEPRNPGSDLGQKGFPSPENVGDTRTTWAAENKGMREAAKQFSNTFNDARAGILANRSF